MWQHVGFRKYCWSDYGSILPTLLHKLVKHEIIELKFSNSNNEIFEIFLWKIVRGMKFSKILKINFQLCRMKTKYNLTKYTVGHIES